MATKAKTANESRAIGTADVGAALRAIRLDRNWSYDDLAAVMARAGHPVKVWTLRRLIQPRPGARHFERTLHQAREFVTAYHHHRQLQLAEQAERAARARERRALDAR